MSEDPQWGFVFRMVFIVATLVLVALYVGRHGLPW